MYICVLSEKYFIFSFYTSCTYVCYKIVNSDKSWLMRSQLLLIRNLELFLTYVFCRTKNFLAVNILFFHFAQHVHMETQKDLFWA